MKMTGKPNKVTSLSKAVSRYIKDGSHISIGGFTINRNPMAAVYEIIRQRITGLHVYAHSNGQAVDELIGAGCVKRLEIAYAGTGRFAPTCIRFKKAVQNGDIMVEDYSNFQMALRFSAGAMGVPFMPVCSGMGTDIIKKWGFPEDFRSLRSDIPDKKLVVIDNPFKGWTDKSKVVLVPAINPDVTIIHVQKADCQGTARIKGLTFADVEQAKAAKHLIITCEELVESAVLREDPDRNQLPHIHADAVIHIPYGAYPTACFGHYDYDSVFLNKYGKIASNDELYNEYLKEHIYNIKNHEELIIKIGEKRLTEIKADPGTGYATGMDRSG